MELKKNTEILKEKHFLMRALEHKNITQEEYDKRIQGMEKRLIQNVQELLAEEYAKLHEATIQVKKTVYTDGDFKRGVARVLIEFLKPNFTKDEIRGVMRQGYRIMRGK